ncbi:MAG: GGDEF domain-containing phosphodiesterase [Acholeplasma sp.]|nr:GGDEF domain-containing phosphodiesterase [Acholeplasma sp.]
MRLSKKRILLTYISSYLLIVLFIFGLYYFFINRLKENYAVKFINGAQIIMNEGLSDYLNSDYNEFLSFDNETVISLNDKNNQNLLSQVPYLEFVNNEDNVFFYKSNPYYINQNSLRDNNFGFFDDKFYFFSDNHVGIIDANEYYKRIFSIRAGHLVFIMDRSGNIYVQSDTETDKTILSEYIPNTSNYTNNFTKGEDVTLRYQSIVYYFTVLEEYPNLYIVQAYNVENILTDFNQYSMFFGLLVVTFTILTFILLLVALKLINNKAIDIENKRLEHYYIKPYVIKLSKDGTVKKFNYKVKEKIDGFKQYKSVKEFQGVNEKISFEGIRRGKAFTAAFGELIIRFLPLKVNNGYYLIGEDVVEIDNTTKEIEFLAYYRPATNLPNLHKLKKDFEKVKGNNIQVKEISFIGFSIRNFANIKQNLNTKTAKLILGEVGKVIVNKSREIDEEILVYNTEEDVFTCLVKNKSKNDIVSFANKILKEFDKPLVITKNKIVISFACGVVTSEITHSINCNANDLYNDLTEVINRAKEVSIRQIVFYDEEMRASVTKKHQMEEDLLKAIDRKEFIVYLQAQYHNELNKIIGFEALVRWNHPKYLRRSPQEFIELAEENGLIVEIGKIIMEKTFEIVKRIEPYNVTVSMNISPVQMLQQGFVDEFLELYRKFNIKSGSISIEVTETFLMQSFELINEKLRLLQKNGVDIHLDDFGTGYSSLPYLKDLSFDAIKIDKVFISHLNTDKYHRAITSMIISLAKNLDLMIIAEGVEDEKQNQFLLKNGCNVIQGYLISKPVDILEAIDLLEEYNVKKTKVIDSKGGRK